MSRLIPSAFLMMLTLGYAGSDRQNTQAREPQVTGDTMAQDTVAQDTLAADTVRGKAAEVDTVLGPGGGEVTTPDSQACIVVPDSAMVGDSMRIAITRLSPRPDLLPSPPPAAFRRAQQAGRRVFPPMYEISAYALPADTLVKRFRRDVFVGICVHASAAQVSRALLAHPHPDDDQELENFDRWPLPCSLRCGTGIDASAQADPLERWLAGSPVTPSLAHASPDQGLGGKGGGPSPIAAVEQGGRPLGLWLIVAVAVLLVLLLIVRRRRGGREARPAAT